MALEDILKKIEEDFCQKKEIILKEAEAKKEAIIKEAEEKAEALSKDIILKATEEAKLEAERQLIREKLEIQKELLFFKRKILEEVFKKAKEAISLKTIKKKIIMPDKEIEENLDKEKFLEEIKPKLEISVSKILWPE